MEIVEWAALDPYRGGVFHSDQRTLLACIRTSRLWHAHAQRILFRKVRIKATDDELLYKSAFDSFVACLVRLHLRRSPLLLEIAALSLGCQSAYFATTIDLSYIPSVLRLTPNLKALHITLLAPDLEIPDLFSFTAEQLRMLKGGPCAQTITHLSLRSQISDPLILHQLLDSLPNVDTLTLEAPRHSTTYAEPLELRSLRTLIIDASISRKCLAYLYRCPMPAIRSLALATLSDLARVHAHFLPHIRDLTVLDASWDAAQADLLEYVVGFPKLERLVVGFHLPRDLLDRLPPGVSHFGFDPYVVPSVDDVLDWLDGRPFVHAVATIFHPEIDDERETPQRAAVKRYCEDTGRQHLEVYRVRPPTQRALSLLTPVRPQMYIDGALECRSKTVTPDSGTPRSCG